MFKIGTDTQIKPTIRHAITMLHVVTNKMPRVAPMNVKAIKKFRNFGSLKLQIDSVQFGLSF